MIGTVVGPHPYPTMVRDFQTVIGEECLMQMPEMAAASPTPWSPAWAAAATRWASSIRSGREHAPDRRRGGAAGLDSGKHSASLTRGAPGCCMASAPTCCRTPTARSPTHSISAASTTPASAPNTLPEGHRPRRVRLTDDEALAAFQRLCRTEGIIPALESSHAVAYAMKLAATMSPDQHLLINLSGAATRTSAPSPTSPGTPFYDRPSMAGHAVKGGAAVPGVRNESRIDEVSRSCASGRAAVIPYIACGDPYADATVDIMLALAAGGADVMDGVPFCDPMADGPVIQKASERALARGISTQVLEAVRGFHARDVPRRWC